MQERILYYATSTPIDWPKPRRASIKGIDPAFLKYQITKRGIIYAFCPMTTTRGPVQATPY